MGKYNGVIPLRGTSTTTWHKYHYVAQAPSGVKKMIENKTRGAVVCRTYELADSSWSKTKGLMFRKGIPRDHGLLMTFPGGSRPGIWMLGMRFPIDIVFLDSEKRVIKIVEDAQPLGLSWRTWRIYSPGKPASFVLELASGKSRDSKTSLGDRLGF